MIIKLWFNFDFEDTRAPMYQRKQYNDTYK